MDSSKAPSTIPSPSMVIERILHYSSPLIFWILRRRLPRNSHLPYTILHYSISLNPWARRRRLPPYRRHPLLLREYSITPAHSPHGFVESAFNYAARIPHYAPLLRPNYPLDPSKAHPSRHTPSFIMVHYSITPAHSTHGFVEGAYHCSALNPHYAPILQPT